MLNAPSYRRFQPSRRERIESSGMVIVRGTAAWGIAKRELSQRRGQPLRAVFRKIVVVSLSKLLPDRHQQHTMERGSFLRRLRNEHLLVLT
jgi:hypothetical protein